MYGVSSFVCVDVCCVWVCVLILLMYLNILVKFCFPLLSYSLVFCTLCSNTLHCTNIFLFTYSSSFIKLLSCIYTCINPLNRISPLQPFSSNANASPNPKAVLLCNPNASLYEFFAYNSQTIDFWVARNVDVVVWNYRGYGESPGYVSPSASRADGVCLVEEMRKRGYLSIAVHSQSIGGVVASYLASSYPDYVTLLVCDRAFCNLPDVSSGTSLSLV